MEIGTLGIRKGRNIYGEIPFPDAIAFVLHLHDEALVTVRTASKQPLLMRILL